MNSVYSGRTWSEFEVGEVLRSPGRTVRECDIATFAGLSGDFNPLHMDAEFCKALPQKRCIAHGGLTFTISAGLFNPFVDGTCIAFLALEFRYTQMVFPGDTLYLQATVDEKRLTSKGKGIVCFGIETQNQRGEAVLQGKWTLLLEPGNV